MDLIRRVALLFTVLTSAVVLAGCGGGPARASAAAIVGDERISLDSVQAEMQWLTDNEPAIGQMERQGRLKLSELSRHIVQSRVRHELIQEAAKRHHITVNASEVESLMQSVGGAARAPAQFGVQASRVREFARDFVLLGKLGQYNIERVTADFVGGYVSGDSPGSIASDKALALGRRIAAHPARAEQLTRQAGSEVIDQTVSMRELVTTGSAQSAMLAASPLFSANEGTVVVIQPNPQQGSLWLVALVQDRRVSATPHSTGGKLLPTQLLYQVGLQQLAPIAAAQGVQISPRFGVWDQASMSIVGNESQFTGHLLPARGSGEQ